MNSLEALSAHLPDIEKQLGYAFKNRDLLLLAFVHRSFFNENRYSVDRHNERLEFLGDAVLGLIVSQWLYEALPSTPEGELSQLRSQIVEANACVVYVHKLQVGPYVLLGRGERMNDGRGRETIWADLFEALIGAIYVDGGLEASKQFFLKHFVEQMHAALKTPLRNWKAELQDYSQKHYQKPPLYVVLKETGPDHSKVFHVAVFVENEEWGQGEGSSKKQAEQAAAAEALKRV